jgi:dephospho-CoA kinase
MKTIGLVGGVASGKSTVAREFARLGAVVLNADEVAHRVLEEPDVKAALVDRWGSEALLADGQVNRVAISRKVFGPASAQDERKFLEELVHPRVRRELERKLHEYSETATQAVVLDVPLLLEVGWTELCDVIYFVDAPWDVRLRRAKDRGWSESELLEREAAQSAVEQKREEADRIIENASTLQVLRSKVEKEWQRMGLS